MGLSEEEVARRAGTTTERVRELASLGIVGAAAGSEEPYRRGDALRAHLVEELDGFGIPPARVAAAIADGALSLSYLDWFPDPSPRAAQTHAELCEELGIPFQL